MINNIHKIVEAHVLSSVSIEDKDNAQELLDLCLTFSSVGKNVYIECLSIMIKNLNLNVYTLSNKLKKERIDVDFIESLAPFPF